MVQSTTTTVDAYLAALPDDRREAIAAVRDVILKNLPKGVAEGMQYGMIGYFIPHSVYPPGYHCDPKQPLPVASIASQKSHMALYLMTVYGNETEEAWFRDAWTATGKKLDMGKACVRFKKIEQVPLEVVGEAFRRLSVESYIQRYEAVLKRPARSKSAAAGAAEPASTEAVDQDAVSASTSAARKSGATAKVKAKSASSAAAEKSRSPKSKSAAKEAAPAPATSGSAGKVAKKARTRSTAAGGGAAAGAESE